MANHANNPRGPGEDAALQALRDALQRAHLYGGEPSTRVIAARTHGAISHTTVAGVIRCERVPRWGQVEVTVEALGFEVDEFRRLWRAAREAEKLQQEASKRSPRISTAASQEQPDIALRLRLVTHQVLFLGGRQAYIGIVDCGQLVEWYGAYHDKLFAGAKREFWRSSEAQRIIADLRRVAPEYLLTHFNGVSILSSDIREKIATEGCLDLIARQVRIINGISTIKCLAYAARDASYDARRTQMLVHVIPSA